VASLTVRKLDERVKKKLRVRAAKRGRSLEEEVRQILGRAAREKEPSPHAKPENMYDIFRRHFEPLGGVELKIPPRSRRIRTPRFEE
jgi:plasmid stability protein